MPEQVKQQWPEQVLIRRWTSIPTQYWAVLEGEEEDGQETEAYVPRAAERAEDRALVAEKRLEELREALETIQGEAYLWGQGEPEGRTCGDCLGHCMRLAQKALASLAQGACTASGPPCECEHPNMQSGAEWQNCPDCDYSWELS